MISEKDKIRNSNRGKRKRRILNKYKVLKGCIDCGYNKSPFALEFDHKDSATKVNTVASLMFASWEHIFKEIAKCDVVCANCHAIRTHKRRHTRLA